MPDNHSPWVIRLERRLSNLTDTASKESIQALSKWIGFRRAHAKAFAESLSKAIIDAAAPRQWLYLQIVNESIVLDSGTSRWDRMVELREALGEACILEVAKKGCLDKETTKKLEGFLKQWDSWNVFGGPTLISLMKKALSSERPKSPTPSKSPTTPPRSRSPTPRSKSPTPKKKRERSASPKPKKKEEAKPKAEEPTSATKAPKKDVVYDFEAKVRG